jgi:hypothetical protein
MQLSGAGAFIGLTLITILITKKMEYGNQELKAIKEHLFLTKTTKIHLMIQGVVPGIWQQLKIRMR